MQLLKNSKTNTMLLSYTPKIRDNKSNRKQERTKLRLAYAKSYSPKSEA